jgi:hypothetical protein
MDVHARPAGTAAVRRSRMSEKGPILGRAFFAGAGDVIDAVVPAPRGTIADPERVSRRRRGRGDAAS